MFLENLIIDKNDLSREHSFLVMAQQTVGKFSSTLKHCLILNRIKTLSMNACNLNGLTLRAIGDGLLSNTTLRSLHLSDNQLKINDLTNLLDACK